MQLRSGRQTLGRPPDAEKEEGEESGRPRDTTTETTTATTTQLHAYTTTRLHDDYGTGMRLRSGRAVMGNRAKGRTQGRQREDSGRTTTDVDYTSSSTSTTSSSSSSSDSSQPLHSSLFTLHSDSDSASDSGRQGGGGIWTASQRRLAPASDDTSDSRQPDAEELLGSRQEPDPTTEELLGSRQPDPTGAVRRSSQTEQSDGAVRRSSRTEQSDRGWAVRRSSQTEQQSDGAVRRSSQTEQSSSEQSDGGVDGAKAPGQQSDEEESIRENRDDKFRQALHLLGTEAMEKGSEPSDGGWDGRTEPKRLDGAKATGGSSSLSSPSHQNRQLLAADRASGARRRSPSLNRIRDEPRPRLGEGLQRSSFSTSGGDVTGRRCLQKLGRKWRNDARRMPTNQTWTHRHLCFGRRRRSRRFRMFSSTSAVTGRARKRRSAVTGRAKKRRKAKNGTDDDNRAEGDPDKSYILGTTAKGRRKKKKKRKRKGTRLSRFSYL